jgi:hypothetical protein
MGCLAYDYPAEWEEFMAGLGQLVSESRYFEEVVTECVGCGSHIRRWVKRDRPRLKANFCAPCSAVVWNAMQAPAEGDAR